MWRTRKRYNAGETEGRPQRGGAKRVCALTLTMIVLSGCAGTMVPMPGAFPQQYSDLNIALGWDCSRAGGAVTVKGVAMSPELLNLTNVQFTLYGMSAQGVQVSQAQGAPQSYVVTDSTPFTVTLQTVGSEVRYDLAFTYTIGEGGGRKGGFDTSPQNGLKTNACPGLK